MRVGITGILGVVGTQLAKRFAEEDIEISGLDNRAQLSEQHGDICNLDDVRKAFKDCDGIVHLAGVSAPAGKELDPNIAHKVNVLGTLNVIDSLLELSVDIKPKWLLYISCYHVYGRQSRFPVTEWVKCHPVTELGVSKLLAEDLVQSKCSKLNIPFGILRLSSVYGSMHTSGLKALPNSLIQQALKGESLICPSDNSTYDFVHIEDAVEAILKSIRILHHDQKSLPTMNICSGVETRASDLVTTLHTLMHTTADIKIIPSYQKQGERFVGSSEKARAVLGWAPKIQLYEGLERLYQALKQTKL
jgi:nucleoside-diphosphate-sugar epimerase